MAWRCRAITQGGWPCEAPPLRGQDFCRWHAPWAKEASRRGGLAGRRSYPAPLPIKPAAELPGRPLTVRQRIWLTLYTTGGSPSFGNATAAAVLAYPRASRACAAVLGHRLKRRLAPELARWRVANGLDWESLLHTHPA
jgi:hypothetical protein